MTKGPDEVYCQSCGEVIKKHAEICPECGVRPGSGSRTAADENFCRSCGEQIKAHAELCPHCGVRQGGSSGPGQPASADRNDVAYYASWTFGVLFILAGLGTFGEGNLVVSFLQGLAYVLVGVVLLPPTRDRLDQEYAATTFGSVRSVEETPVAASDEPCASCYSDIEDGVLRSYSEEFVLFGVPLYTLDEGRNHYCRACANGAHGTATARSNAETEVA